MLPSFFPEPPKVESLTLILLFFYGEKGRFARRNPDPLAGPVILLSGQVKKILDFRLHVRSWNLENAGRASGFACF